MTKFNNIHHKKTSSNLCGKIAGPRGLCALGILMLSLIALAPVVDAGCACSAVGNWEAKAQEFLKSDDTGGQPVSSSSAQASTAATQPKTLARSESFPNGEILKPVKNVSSSELVIDVSNGDSYAKSHIKNAIHIPTKDFLDGEGNLKTNEELAKILGNAGVSRDDSIVLYGNSESSGEAEFAFLVLRYLGQKDVKLLDGSLADWQAAGLPVEASENNRPGVEYKPEIKPNVIADYEYVKSGQAQIMDARPFVEFGKGRIPGSTALDSANIIKGDKIRNGGELGLVFSRLSKDQPIVVYSSDYSRSSLVWYALQLMGYEASIYTWEDWKAHETADSQAATATAEENVARSKYTKLGSM
jgi:thiosulfate/3-mercaptopyruvate sulfurtransferase